MTTDEAWDAIKHTSEMYCRYITALPRWGCDTLEGCPSGEQCDVLNHMAELWDRFCAARKIVGA